MDKPQFIDIDAQGIIDDMVSAYEDATGKVLSPGQAEYLLINAWAYREYLLRTAIQNAALQNLVNYATAPALDQLGVLVGVERLDASSSVCNIKMTLVEGHQAINIPSGIRIQSIDGQVIFITTESVSVAVGVNTANVEAECQTEGVAGNDYAIGQISIILDPQPYLTAATNTDVTQGGADAEDDDNLRERIKLAPSSFSNAGSIGAYKYWAKTASSLIYDISVTSPTPGTVVIYPLLENGEIPNAEILQAISDACNDEKVRPLTDTVSVEAPTAIDYDIEVDIVLLNTAIQDDVVSTIKSNLSDYATARKERMGIDVVKSQIIGKCYVDGVYSVSVAQPTADIIIDNGQFANIGTITVNVTGTSDE